MDIFEQASRQKLRINYKGELSVEQVWDLRLDQLDELAVHLETQVDKSTRKSFLTKASKADSLAKLRFDVVFSILQTKVKEAQDAADASERKYENQRILSLIEAKKDAERAGKSIEELEALLK